MDTGDYHDHDDTIEWRLSSFRHFCETDDAHQAPDGAASTEAVTTTKTAQNGVWVTRQNHTAALLVVRFSPSLAHISILQGSEIIESLFLILAKKWIKAVIIDDENLLYIRQGNSVRRLRLVFVSADDARSCYAHLSLLVSVKQTLPPNPLASVDGDANDDDARISSWLESIVGGGGGGRSAMTAAAWETQWPTDRLLDLVKLCLLDSNFPGFVHQVHQSLQLLTSTADQQEDPGDAPA